MQLASGLSRFSKIFILFSVVAIIAFFTMISSLAGMVSHFSDGIETKSKGPHLTQLTIEGPIMESEHTLSIIESISKDENCKGVLLRIESPGGAVGASQEIFSGLKRLRKGGLPVVVSFGNIAASGGYYIALAGSPIFANPGTLTGSIGVIFQFPEAEDLMKKVGITFQTVKSGALKDIGNPSRKPTESELRFLQSVIDDTYGQFIEDVAESRKIPLDSVRPLADGRIFTGKQAQKKGLIDSLGGLDDAKREIIRITKLTGNVEWVKEPKPKSRVEQFLDPESQSSALSRMLSKVSEKLRPGSFFMWQ